MRWCPKIGKYQVRMTFDKAILLLRSNLLGVFSKFLTAITLWLEACYTWWTSKKMWNKGCTVVKPVQLESRKLGLQTNCHQYRILTANNKFTWPKSFHTPWPRKNWIWRKKPSFSKIYLKRFARHQDCWVDLENPEVCLRNVSLFWEALTCISSSNIIQVVFAEWV